MKQTIFAFLRGLASFVIVAGAVVGLEVVARGRVPEWVGMAVGTVVLLALYLATARWIERRRPDELVRREGGVELIRGVVVGVVLFSIVMAGLAAGGLYRPTGWNGMRPLAWGISVGLVAAITEEMLFRGFLFRIIAILGGDWVALAVTAALFGLAHRANPHATLASCAAIAIEAGIMLGAAYAASGSLWLPIGIHAGWNFAEGPLYGMAVSGISKGGAIAGQLHGPVLWTGGTFGPEASLGAVIVCVAMASVYLRQMLKRHERPSGGPAIEQQQHVLH